MEIPERSSQSIGAITRGELNECTFGDVDRLWGAILRKLATSDPDFSQLPILVPAVCWQMISDFHFIMRMSLRAARRAADEMLEPTRRDSVSSNVSVANLHQMESGRSRPGPRAMETSTEVLAKAVRDLEEDKKAQERFQLFTSDLTLMSKHLNPLVQELTGQSDRGFHSLYATPYEDLKELFPPPINEKQICQWATCMGLQRAWMEYLVLKHCCGRAYLRHFNNLI